MNFTLSDEQIKSVNEWIDEQDKIVKLKQGLSGEELPYYGAIGGEVTYSFTPTSLGLITIVKHAGTDNTVDLTEYNDW